jgi:hypothetical protein
VSGGDPVTGTAWDSGWPGLEDAEVTATFAVSGGHTAKGRLNLLDLSPTEIAERIHLQLPASVVLCHECAHEVVDPELGELTGFEVGGTEFVRTARGWAPRPPDPPSWPAAFSDK